MSLDGAQVTLDAGQHQLVLQFEGSFRDQSESRLIRGEPVVFNLKAQADDQLSIQFTYPRNFQEAERYLKQQELKVIMNIVAALGDRPGLGLQAASRYPVTAFGVWGFAILTSPTLGEAVDVAVRFVQLSYAFCTFETRRHGDDLSIVIDARAVPAPIRRFLQAQA